MERGHERNFLEDIHDGWEFVDVMGGEGVWAVVVWVGTGVLVEIFEK